MKNFEDYGLYYNLFYNDKDYKKEAAIVDNIIKKYQKEEKKSLLNIGCGTGRHDFELCKMGYEVHGIDLSPIMIQMAKSDYKNENKLSFEVADAQHYRSEIKYDVVTSLFHVMSYQNQNREIMNAFKSAYSSLKEDGLFIFDVWYGPGVLTEKPENRKKVVENNEKMLIRFAEPVMYPNENVVDVNYSVYIVDKKEFITEKIDETHSMRYFFLPEIKKYLSDAGFYLLECMDCKTLEKPDFSSWTVYFVAKRK